MILHIGERVYWGAPEIIYLEGTIVSLDEQAQTVVVHIDRTTAHSAHLIGTDVPFAANGISPLQGESPAGVTTERPTERQAPMELSDDEKIRRAAIAAVHQRYGTTLPEEQERNLVAQVIQALQNDPALRAQIIASMNEILHRQQSGLLGSY